MLHHVPLAYFTIFIIDHFICPKEQVKRKLGKALFFLQNLSFYRMSKEDL